MATKVRVTDCGPEVSQPGAPLHPWNFAAVFAPIPGWDERRPPASSLGPNRFDSSGETDSVPPSPRRPTCRSRSASPTCGRRSSARPRRAAGAAGRGQDDHRPAAPARRAVARRRAHRGARTTPTGGPGRRPPDGLPARRGGRGHRRLPDPRRAPGRRAHPDRGGDRGDPHPPPPARSLAPRRRPGDLRRDPRAEPAGRPGPGAHPRRPGGAAARAPHPRHVGHARHRAGRRAARTDCRRRRCWDGPAPVVASDGRSHPVDVRWRPTARPPAGRGRGGRGAARAAVGCGDVLVFLAGAADIRRVRSSLARAVPRRRRPTAVRRPVARRAGPGSGAVAARATAGRARHRHRRDQPHRRRRADRGRQRPGAQPALRPAQRVDPAAHRAELAGIGRSAGGPGRAHRSGVAYRLWSEGEHAHRRAFAPPEIESVDLAGLALELAVWGPRPRPRVPRSAARRAP